MQVLKYIQIQETDRDCLLFTQTTRLDILCINKKPQNLTWLENDPLKCVSTFRSAEQTKKSRKSASPQIIVHVF